MRLFIKYACLIVMVLLFSGCMTLSVNPFYLDNDVIENDSILGKWSQLTEDSVAKLDIVVKPFEDYAMYYDFCISQNGIENSFFAKLFELNQEMYIDISPRTDTLTEANSILLDHLIKAHSVAKITINGDELTLNFLNQQNISNIIMVKKLKMDFAIMQELGDQILLTGPTEEVRELLCNYSKELFSEELALEFERK